jgi:hypothetical protein
MGEQAQEASDLALSEAARRPESATQPTALHLDFICASEQEAEARSSEQRKQLETMKAAQVEREKALPQAEKALKQRILHPWPSGMKFGYRFAVTHPRWEPSRTTIALVVVSVLAVVAVFLGWGAEQQRRIAEFNLERKETAERYRINAEQQKEQTDTVLARATKIAAQDEDRDPAKVREFLE